MTSCSDKKEVKTDFTNANEAFSYFIDTTGLVRDKNDSKLHIIKSKLKPHFKSIFSNSYNIYFKYGRKLYKKPSDKIVEIFNKDGQITRRYLKYYEVEEKSFYKGNSKITSFTPYETNIIHVFKYNNQKQLVKFYILLDYSSIDKEKTEFSGVHEFTYFTSKDKQDSVFVNAYGFSSTYGNGSGMHSYDRINNKINAYFGFYYTSTLLEYYKSLYRHEKEWGYYTENFVKY